MASKAVWSPTAVVGHPTAVVGPSTAVVGAPTAVVGPPTAVVGLPTAVVGLPTAVLVSCFLLPTLLSLGFLRSGHSVTAVWQWLDWPGDYTFINTISLRYHRKALI